MQSNKVKAAKVTSPTRRQKPVRYNDARNSHRKDPNGSKAAIIAMLLICLCPLLWNRRVKSSVRVYPKK